MADVLKLKEGEEDYEQFWKCSKCGERAYYLMRFCPNYGTKMDGKGESEVII